VLFDVTLLGERVSRIKYAGFFGTRQDMDTLFEPAVLKVKVRVGKYWSARHLYVTTAGPFVVMAASILWFEGHLTTPAIPKFPMGVEPPTGVVIVTLVTWPFNACGLGGAFIDCATAAEAISNNPSTVVANRLDVFSDTDIRFLPS